MKHREEAVASELHCSFCGKSQETVERLISSPNDPRAYICDECVLVCASILEGERQKPPRAIAHPIVPLKD
jgi:ATP-dependent Clp protease ATP-binding subunit ClpX